MSVAQVATAIDITPFTDKIGKARRHLDALQDLVAVDKKTVAVAEKALKELVQKLEDATRMGSPKTLPPLEAQRAVGIKLGIFNDAAQALCDKNKPLDDGLKTTVTTAITNFRAYIHGLTGSQAEEKGKTAAEAPANSADGVLKKGVKDLIKPALAVVDKTTRFKIQVTCVNFAEIETDSSRASKARYQVSLNGRAIVGNFKRSQSLSFEDGESAHLIKILETEVDQVHALPIAHTFNTLTWAMEEPGSESPPAALPAATGGAVRPRRSSAPHSPSSPHKLVKVSA